MDVIRAGAEPRLRDFAVRHRDRDWIVPLAMILGVELLAWGGLFAAGLAFRPLVLRYEALALAALAPVAGFRLLIGRRWRVDRSRLAGAIIGMQMFVLAASLFGSLKACLL
jgi:hypothetical protein